MANDKNYFAKNILVYDFETTHGDPNLAEPTQLAAILLDRQTLQEIENYSSYIYNDMERADPVALSISGITRAQLTDAPKIEQVGREFYDQFGPNVLLSSWNEMLDRRMLEKVIVAGGHGISEYDYHYLDIWPVAYVHLVKIGKADVLRSSQIFREFGLGERGSHEALEDCRMAAEVLRNLMKN